MYFFFKLSILPSSFTMCAFEFSVLLSSKWILICPQNLLFVQNNGFLKSWFGIQWIQNLKDHTLLQLF